MPRRRRYIISQQAYAVTFRTKEGLPFVATAYMKLILAGILARAQRDSKVTLCHFLWMGNHAHLILVAHDPQQLVNFYQEVQKKVTDTIKMLLGLKYLNMWQGRPIVQFIDKEDRVADQIAYLYANPARANLVESIAEYPGLSSYQDFIKSTNSTDATIIRKEKWLPSSLTPLLPARSMRKHKDLDFTKELEELSIAQDLELKPNAWMECFGVSQAQDVKLLNESIHASIALKEEDARKLRQLEKKPVLGERNLRVQEIMKPHKPAPLERRSFIISSSNELRMAFIKQYDAICELCKECYEKAKRGISCEWPPGVFRPALGQLASALDW